MSASGSRLGFRLLAFGRGRTAAEVLGSAIAGLIAGVFVQGIRIIDAVVTLITSPLDALAAGPASLITAFFDANAAVLTAAARTTIATIAPGGTFAQLVGPLAFVFGVAQVLVVLWLLGRFLRERSTTNIGLLGTGIDVPTPGFGTAEEEAEE
jgi:hypothetical protein